MPEFIHGDLEITVNVAVKSLSYGSGLDKMFRKVLNVDLSSNNVLVSFKPIWTSSPLDQKQTNWLIKYITEFLATKINPINVPLPPSFQNLKNVEVDFNEAEPGNIWDSWYDYSGGWHKQKINTPNNSIRAPFAAGDVFVSVYNPGTGNDSQQHFVYVDKNGNIWDVWYDYSGGWHLQQINKGVNSCTQGPPAVDGVFVSAYNPGGGDSQQHFTYLDKNGTICDAWYDYGGGWHLQNICSPGNNITARQAMGHVFVCAYNPGSGNDSQQHFVYVDKDGSGKIWDVFYDYQNGSGKWNLQQINKGVNSCTQGPPAVGGVFVSVYTPGTGNDSQQHFTYLDKNGTIWDAWYDYGGGWHLQNICSPGNNITAPAAVGDVFVSVYNPGTGNDSQQHFVYVDKDGSGKIWDVWYDYGGGWHLQQINAGSNSSVTSSPPSIGNVFVSAYNPGGGDSQQHFAYRELPSGFGVVLVSILPNSPSNPYPGSVTADLVGGNDFALAASSGYIAHLIQNQKLTLSDFQINFNWSIGPVSGTITYNIHVNSVTVGLSSGHVTLTVTGHAHTNSNIAGVGFPDTDFTITQNVSLAISGGTVVLSALGDPSISLSGILGSIQGAFNGQLVNSIKPKRDQLLQQVQTSFQSMLKTQTQSIIQSINKSLKVSPQITYSGVTVDADGIVLFGSIGFKDRVPVHAEFTQRNAANQPGQIELNALASWVPGGTIGNEPPGEVAFVWSLKRDSNDTKPTVITELHKFVTRFKNDIPASYICLTVYGTRVTGETVSGEHCQ